MEVYLKPVRRNRLVKAINFQYPLAFFIISGSCIHCNFNSTVRTTLTVRLRAQDGGLLKQLPESLFYPAVTLQADFLPSCGGHCNIRCYAWRGGKHCSFSPWSSPNCADKEAIMWPRKLENTKVRRRSVSRHGCWGLLKQTVCTRGLRYCHGL